MTNARNLLVPLVVLFMAGMPARGQAATDVKEKAVEIAETAKQKIDVVAEKVDQTKEAQEVSAGILKPIYQLAERLSFPAFHWIAFTCMVAGVVSFGLQLVLGKLVVLTQLGLSLTEILSDGLGLVVSLFGLVLTTQAAAQNSTFTSSPFAVISAAVIGAIAGFIFYLWGQRHELDAVQGRKKVPQKT